MRPDEPSPLEAALARDEDLAEWGEILPSDERTSLVELVNRVLDKGVVITGDVTISVAGVELVYLGLNAVLTSVSTLRSTLAKRESREE